MTREEAIEIVKTAFSAWESEFRVPNDDWSEENEALDMAIEALKAETAQGVGRYENAMQKLREMPKYLNGVKKKQITKISAEAVPPADRPRGEWMEPTSEAIEKRIYGSCEVVCSVCEAAAVDFYDFCPNCGADMRGDTE